MICAPKDKLLGDTVAGRYRKLPLNMLGADTVHYITATKIACLPTLLKDESFKLLTNYYKLFHFRTNETSQDLKITDNDLNFKKVRNYKLLQLSYFPYFYNWIRAPIKD